MLSSIKSMLACNLQLNQSESFDIGHHLIKAKAMTGLSNVSVFMFTHINNHEEQNRTLTFKYQIHSI